LAKFYDEKKGEPLRRALDAELLNWPEVTARKMFGCPCYLRSNSLFTFIVNGGIVLTKIAEEDRESVMKTMRAAVFDMGRGRVNKWLTIPVRNADGLKKVLPYIRKSYEGAIL
jgi:hypothetical protein